MPPLKADRSPHGALRTVVRCAAGFLALLAIATGCIEFEQQTMVYHYDDKTDELRILQIYHGIFGGDDNPALSQQEVNQLRSVLERDRTFFFANWIFEYDEKAMHDATEPPEDPPETQTDAETHTRMREFAQHLLDRVDVQNGGFYQDAENRLCGFQFVRIAAFRETLAEANQLFTAIVLSNSVADDFFGKNPDENPEAAAHRKRFRTAAQNDHDWLAANGNQITLQFPATPQMFMELKSDCADSLRKAVKPENKPVTDVDLQPLLMLLENPAWIGYRNNMITVRTGYPDMSPVKVHATCFSGYKDNALAFVEQNCQLIEQPDFDSLIDTFVLEGEPLPQTQIMPQ